MLGAVASDETLLKDPDWLGDILTSAIPADGVGVWINGSYAFSGVTPPTDDFRRIVRALNGTAAGKVYSTDHIGSLIDNARSFEKQASGLLAIPISRSPRDYVVLFRSEMRESVRWAGDPHKPVEYGPNGPRLTPRESFAEWHELVEGRSKPFTPSELRVAETLRATLIEVVLRLADEASALRHQANARQELLIAELNHRVRNILGVIRGLIRQSQPEEEAVKDFVRVVDGRIHALARAHNQITDDHWGPAPFRGADRRRGRRLRRRQGNRDTFERAAVLLNPAAYSTMALVIHELVTNSTKYGSLSVAEGYVQIQWRRDDGGDLHLDLGGARRPASREAEHAKALARRSSIVRFPTTSAARRKCTMILQASARGSAFPLATFPSPRTSRGRSSGCRTRGPCPSRPIKADLLADQSVLVVEDSLIIALDAEDILSRFGANVASASNSDAAHTISTTTSAGFCHS